MTVAFLDPFRKKSINVLYKFILEKIFLVVPDSEWVDINYWSILNSDIINNSLNFLFPVEDHTV